MGNKEHARRIHFIDKGFQGKFILKFCLIVILGSIITMALLYFFSSKATTVRFENTEAVVRSTKDFILPILIQTVVITTILMGLFTILLTLLISHKIAGPLYRFRKEIELIGNGDLRSEFKIRKDDQIKNLADVINKVKMKLKNIISKDKDNIEELEKLVSELDIEREKKKKMESKVTDIKNNLDYFKT